MPKPFTRKCFSKLPMYILAVTAAVFSLLAGVSTGSLSIPFSSIIEILASQWLGMPLSSDVPSDWVPIVMAIRLPRVVLAFLVGASLALAGAAFQGLLKNALADPYTLGVSSGASVGAVLVIFLGWQWPLFGTFTLPIVSIVCGMATLAAVLAFTRAVDRRMSVETIILAGIIFGAFFSAFISLMIALTGDELRQIISWLMGSVAMRGWTYSGLLLPFFLVGAATLIANGRELNAFAFGEAVALHVGVDVARRKIVILTAAALLTGAAVSVSGTIGFVGLVVPHIVRLLCGPDYRVLLPLSLLYGGAFLVFADLAARTIIEPRELPIGVITSLVGAPLFAVLFFRKTKRKLG
ncbi:FecCD family ABC transporter permease [Geobacillus sp. C56-T2]|uniref:FecCD family ABC transporter permease n=1 Tax=Geobacillus sp. C56-T2 TaxID=600773 RepID=UPI00351A42F3